MRLYRTTLFAFAAVTAIALPGLAQAESTPPPADDSSSVLDKDSPWLLAPVFSSNPKLGTSLGALAGYLHNFDAKSRPSMFGLSAQYSTTNSLVGGAIARASFDEDRQRVIAGMVYGNIKNDYDDYLGTGIPLKNEAQMRGLIGRYTYRVKDDWFAGVQGIKQNFSIAGNTAFDQTVLDILGVQSYKSAGLGLVLQNDSRDDENIPTQGALFNLNNMAFRESLGGQDDYDVYRLEGRYFHPFGQGNVLALRQLNHLTHDAPAAARAPVQLRGYKVGQYTGQYMSSFEAETRLRLAERWTATVFAGLACLYGAGQDCVDKDSLFPAGGAGLQYILKPKQGIVLNLELADGLGSNFGAYLKMGYAY